MSLTITSSSGTPGLHDFSIVPRIPAFKRMAPGGWIDLMGDAGAARRRSRNATVAADDPPKRVVTDPATLNQADRNRDMAPA
jgi:hypothetical protein